MDRRQLAMLSMPLFQPPPSSLRPQTIASIHLTQASDSNSVLLPAIAAANISSDDMSHERPPRPNQGGERISEDMLRAMGTTECIWRFRFTPDELVELSQVLAIPDPFKTRTRSIFPALEALCLLCTRFRFDADEFDMVSKYDRSQSAISECINELVVFLDERWGHLLGYDHEFLLHPRQLASYAEAVFQNGSPLQNVFGFIDGTIRRICRPSRHQREAFNGYKRFHALKYQAVILPNGMFGHLFGPMEGRRADGGVLEESGLLERCAEYAFREGTDENTPLPQRNFVLYGDPAYGVGPHIQCPYPSGPAQTEEQREWNELMAAQRIEVEHGFGIVLNYWPFLNAWWKHRVFDSPVGRYYRVGVLLTNALNCYRPNQIAMYFNSCPPSVHEYFHD